MRLPTAKDVAETQKLLLFRSDLTSFINAYDFLSQVINFENTDLEKLTIYGRGLARLIRPRDGPRTDRPFRSATRQLFDQETVGFRP